MKNESNKAVMNLVKDLKNLVDENIDYKRIVAIRMTVLPEDGIQIQCMLDELNGNGPVISKEIMLGEAI